MFCFHGSVLSGCNDTNEKKQDKTLLIFVSFAIIINTLYQQSLLIKNPGITLHVVTVLTIY